MLYLKDDMDVSFFIFFGIIVYILGFIYLSECFLKVIVLNLGILKLLLCSVYLSCGI